MAYTTENTYTGNGSTVLFSFTFPYLETTDVKVSVNQVDRAVGTGSTEYQLASATQVQFNTAPTSGQAIRIYRDTNIDNLQAEFFAGSAIRSQDLNEDFKQNLYVSQETEKKVDGKWNNTTDTIDSSETWASNNTNIATTGAIDARVDSKIDTALTTDVVGGTSITVDDDTPSTGKITIKVTSGGITATQIATDTITATQIASDTITSQQLAPDCVGNSELEDNAVGSANIINDSIVNADINSSAAIGLSKLATGALPTGITVASANIVNGTIVDADLASDTITAASIAADAITASELANDAVDTNAIANLAVATGKIANDAIDGTKIADNAIDSEHYTDASIDHAHLADDSIDGDNIQDDAIDSEHYTDGSIDKAHIADDQIDVAKIDMPRIETLAGMQSGTASKLAEAQTLTADINDLNIVDGMTKQTTISDSDTSYPTSGAVVDYVAAQIAPVGGLEVIANDESFPETQPAAGVVVSIADAGGLVVNGSGVSTTGDTITTNATVTINNINSQFNSTTIADGVGMQVSSTGSGQIYNYHKALLKESDLANLSTDIQDFGNRYRTAASRTSDADASNDDGDLFFDQTANKMFVYDGTAGSGGAWKEVTSIGDFKILVMCNTGTTNAATIDGSTGIAGFDLKEGSTSGAAASVTNAQQLIVSVNGVIQKPNTGTNPSGLDGFVMADADTIKFCANLPNGAEVFITQCGSAVSIGTPGDNTVSAAKIQSGAVELAKMAANSVDSDQYVDGSIDSAHIGNDQIDSQHYAAGSIDNEHMSANSVDSDQYVDGSIDTVHLADQAVDLTKLPHGDGTSDGKFLRSNNGADPTWVAVSSTPEGEAVLSTTNSNEANTKFLRADGDGTCSWQIPPGLGKILQIKVHEATSALEYVSGNYGTWYDYDQTTCTFTPSKAGTKMLVTFNSTAYMDGQQGTTSVLRIKAVSTEGTRYLGIKFYNKWDAPDPLHWSITLSGDDTPSQSSANQITYTAQHAAWNSYTGTNGYSGIGFNSSSEHSTTTNQSDTWTIMEYE